MSVPANTNRRLTGRHPGLLLLLLGILLLVRGPITPIPAAAQDAPDAGHAVNLIPGWNLVGWLGPDTPVADALGDTLAAVASVNTFDAATQTFSTFTVGGPDFLNTLDLIPAGAGVWLLATAAATWTQPGLPPSNGELATAQITGRDVPLLPGFNLVAWTGDHNALIDAAVAGIDGLDSLFLWDAPAEVFLSFGPTRPAFLNSATALPFGAGLWMLMTAAATWQQPAALIQPDGSARIDFPDLAARLIIPPGALPDGVSPSDLQITDATTDSEFLDPGSTELPPTLVLRLEPSGLQFDPPLTLALEVPPNSGGFLFSFVSADGPESIDGVTSTVDADTGVTTLAVPITHFSEVLGMVFDIVSANAVNVGPVLVGDQFDAVGDVSVDDVRRLKGFRFGDRNVLTGWRSVPPFTMSGTFTVESGPVSPAFIAARTEIAGLIGGPFRCTAPGPFTILLRGIGSTVILRETFLNSVLEESLTRSLVDGAEAEIRGECVAPKLIDDLTPTGFRQMVPNGLGGYDFISRARFAGVVVREIPGELPGEEELELIPGATVTATIVFPDGSERQETVTTNANGAWSISAVHGDPGTFTIKDIRITCPDSDLVHLSDETASILVT